MENNKHKIKNLSKFIQNLTNSAQGKELWSHGMIQKNEYLDILARLSFDKLRLFVEMSLKQKQELTERHSKSLKSRCITKWRRLTERSTEGKQFIAREISFLKWKELYTIARLESKLEKDIAQRIKLPILKSFRRKKFIKRVVQYKKYFFSLWLEEVYYSRDFNFGLLLCRLSSMKTLRHSFAVWKKHLENARNILRVLLLVLNSCYMRSLRLGFFNLSMYSTDQKRRSSLSILENIRLKVIFRRTLWSFHLDLRRFQAKKRLENLNRRRVLQIILLRLRTFKLLSQCCKQVLRTFYFHKALEIYCFFRWKKNFILFKHYIERAASKNGLFSKRRKKIYFRGFYLRAQIAKASRLTINLVLGGYIRKLKLRSLQKLIIHAQRRKNILDLLDIAIKHCEKRYMKKAFTALETNKDSMKDVLNKENNPFEIKFYSHKLDSLYIPIGKEIKRRKPRQLNKKVYNS
eukprot:snap_masked-scaffold_51-processed-gene-1.45-mRNA-1 protein AED:1.00 eAED:1.00 QI:0/-1/0/0/-1/1/1/0/461